jgi:probable DNA metabolism protein
MTIFLCRNSLEGIMTGVYDAYAGKLGYENVKLATEDEMDRELFAEYVEVEPDGEKAAKVLRTIRRELGLEAFESICQAAANRDSRKANAIFKTIVLGLHLPKTQKVMNCLTKDEVCIVAQLSKRTWNEAHSFMGYVRFSELAGGILYAEIQPENDVLPIIGPHFANRYPEEHWVIYDSGREKFAIHRAGKGWMIAEDMHISKEMKSQLSMEEEDYQAMWRAFHESIAIEARKNEGLQKKLLPLRFRDKMTEFESRTSI